MADEERVDVTMDEYNESEDSDFNANDGSGDESVSSDEDEAVKDESSRGPKRRKTDHKASTQKEEIAELDSGDEATIREQTKSKRKAKRAGEASDGEDDEGWRAKTRSMREREKDEKKKSKLASAKGSTVDVEKLWAAMNTPGNIVGKILDPSNNEEPENKTPAKADAGKIVEEMITIKRTYKFAGEVHTEEKTVPKSSAEARLWLAQQEARGKKENAETSTTPDEQPIRRPLRRISRFDPNFNNLEAFKKTWTKSTGTTKEAKGPKLNVVEKSKIDWAAHVDSEGLKDELALAAKAKEGYLGRMDFLSEVEAKKEEEARKARMKT